MIKYNVYKDNSLEYTGIAPNIKKLKAVLGINVNYVKSPNYNDTYNCYKVNNTAILNVLNACLDTFNYDNDKIMCHHYRTVNTVFDCIEKGIAIPEKYIDRLENGVAWILDEWAEYEPEENYEERVTIIKEFCEQWRLQQ